MPQSSQGETESLYIADITSSYSLRCPKGGCLLVLQLLHRLPTSFFISLFVSGLIHQSKPLWEGTCMFQCLKNNIQKVAWEDLAHSVWPCIWCWPLAAKTTVGKEEGGRGGRGSHSWPGQCRESSWTAWPRVHSDSPAQLSSQGKVSLSAKS